MGTISDYFIGDWDIALCKKLQLTSTEKNRIKEKLPGVLKKHDIRDELRFIAPAHRGRTADYVLMRLQFAANMVYL